MHPVQCAFCGLIFYFYFFVPEVDKLWQTAPLPSWPQKADGVFAKPWFPPRTCLCNKYIRIRSWKQSPKCLWTFLPRRANPPSGSRDGVQKWPRSNHLGKANGNAAELQNRMGAWVTFLIMNKKNFSGTGKQQSLGVQPTKNKQGLFLVPLFFKFYLFFVVDFSFLVLSVPGFWAWGPDSGRAWTWLSCIRSSAPQWSWLVLKWARRPVAFVCWDEAQSDMRLSHPSAPRSPRKHTGIPHEKAALALLWAGPGNASAYPGA